MNPVSVWRIAYCEPPIPDEAKILKGMPEGSGKYDGRWHYKSGCRVVYAASSRALCQLEKRVHTNGIATKNLILVRLELPEDAQLQTAEDSGLSQDWRNDIAYTRKFGEEWLASCNGMGLWVPSAVEPHEYNLLINPSHQQYAKIRLHIERNPFEFDPRLF